MKAIILSIGDELVLGQTLDTNSQWLSQQLAANGCDPVAHMTVADDQKAIEDAISACAPRCDVMLISGGLGPTADDLTRQALAALMGVPLELNTEWLTEMERFFKLRNRPMPQTNQIQAMIPHGAQMIWNTCGTAAGIRAQLKSMWCGEPGEQRTTEIFVMPGVPKEMKAMFQRDALPFIQQRAAGSCILSTTLHTFGLGESAIAEQLGPLMARDRSPSVGTTVSHGLVSLRINARCTDRQTAESQLAQTVAACRQALGDLIFGTDDQTLAQAVAELIKAHPLAQRWAPAVCTAESCTGGLLAKYLTDVPGSSAYFRQGWVTYDNEAKQNELGVQAGTLQQHGAVSEQVVREMAQGAATRSGAPFALAVSGVAGPDGGTPGKPVGTVCLGLTYPADGAPERLDCLVRTFNFPGDREMIRDRSAKMALTMLRYHLLGQPMPF